MFGIFKNNDGSEVITNDNFLTDLRRRTQQSYCDWLNTDNGKRISHLQTLIIKTYKSVNIEADLIGIRIDESFTREDYLEDFKVFFKEEIFKKLREWCKEYEILRAEESKILNEM